MLSSFVSAVLLCLALHPGTAPLASDNEFQFFIGERVASGVPVYASHYTPKTAATFLITGGAVALGRWIGVPDIVAARALSIIVFGFVVGLTSWIAYELTESVPLAALGGFTMLSFCGLVYHAVQGSRPKIFVVLFSLLTLWLLMRRRTGWAGAAAATTILTWQPGILVAGPAAVATLFMHRRGRAFGSFLLAGLCIALAYESYFLWHGMVAEQLYQSIYVPLFLMPSGGHSWSSLWHGMQRLWPRAFGHGNPATWAFILVVPALAAAFLRGRRVTALDGNRRAAGWAVLASAALVTLATFYDHQGYPDVLFMAPFVALAPPMLLYWLSGRRRLYLSWVTSLALAFWIAAVALPQVIHPRDLATRHYTLQAQERLARKLQELAGPRGTIYAQGSVHLLAFLHRDNWSRWGFLYRGWKQVWAHDPAGPIPTLENPGRRGLPSVVISDRPGKKRMFKRLLAGRYEVAQLPEFRRQRIMVWIRR